uniref:Dehaloperoxidase A n=1 Tax=Amphitrite ornata TaxID=129555 RepID=UPI0003C73A6F|nr:Chain A, Dehaloperoxidase A [Amphitrite ornata]4JAC_B Chain B, Dehaloperoxidase A [Amphitrite ornata]
MGFKQDIATIRGDLRTYAQDIFLAFLNKYPDERRYFKNYVGKSDQELKSMAKFGDHSEKVFNLMMEVADRATDCVPLASDANTLVQMKQHSSLTTGNFEKLFVALVEYMRASGQSFDSQSWDRFGKNLVSALSSAGMK